MAYTINLTNGNILTTVADGTINTTYSQVLIGKNYAGYGQFLDDNFVHLLESGANSSAPSNPLTGQLWFDTSTGLLKIYNGTIFKTISAATSSSSAPSNNVQGDLWYNTTTQQLSVWTGSAWLVVGPSTTGGTGAVSTVITDISTTAHQVLEFTVGNSIVGIVSKDTTFTPQNAIPGFTTIAPGINLAANIAGNVTYFSGTATDSLLLNGLSANSFVRSDANTSTTGTLSVLNNTGLYVGLNSDLNIGVTGTAVNIKNQTVNGNITFSVNKSVGGQTTVMTINGSNGTISGNQINANYADVAERFEADTILEPGTVVELGGEKEITKVSADLSDSVFGVISTRAAYLMNSSAGSDETHPPVAMTGRVPVKVKGIVKKGDRLVSAGNGFARAAQPGEATPFNVVGRALVNKDSSDDGVVEAIVTIK